MVQFLHPQIWSWNQSKFRRHFSGCPDHSSSIHRTFCVIWPQAENFMQDSVNHLKWSSNLSRMFLQLSFPVCSSQDFYSTTSCSLHQVLHSHHFALSWGHFFFFFWHCLLSCCSLCWMNHFQSSEHRICTHSLENNSNTNSTKLSEILPHQLISFGNFKIVLFRWVYSIRF